MTEEERVERTNSEDYTGGTPASSSLVNRNTTYDASVPTAWKKNRGLDTKEIPKPIKRRKFGKRLSCVRAVNHNRCYNTERQDVLVKQEDMRETETAKRKKNCTNQTSLSAENRGHNYNPRSQDPMVKQLQTEEAHVSQTADDRSQPLLVTESRMGEREMAKKAENKTDGTIQAFSTAEKCRHCYKLEGQDMVLTQPQKGEAETVNGISTDCTNPPFRMTENRNHNFNPHSVVDATSLGLESLAHVGMVTVKQAIDVFEVVMPFEVSNRYEIRDMSGMKLFDAVEESNCLLRHVCGPRRPLTMYMRNPSGDNVVMFERPFKPGVHLCPFLACLGRDCQDEMMASTLSEDMSGYVLVDCAPIYQTFSTYGPGDEPLSIIEAPGCWMMVCKKCMALDFPIMRPDGEEIGMVTKEFAGCLQECCTNATNFTIQFQETLDVRHKALLLGALLLLDFTLFEFN